jgi:hypothetical protein
MLVEPWCAVKACITCGTETRRFWWGFRVCIDCAGVRVGGAR